MEIAGNPRISFDALPDCKALAVIHVKPLYYYLVTTFYSSLSFLHHRYKYASSPIFSSHLLTISH